jgi:peptidoglycan-associated lipoprotein
MFLIAHRRSVWMTQIEMSARFLNSCFRIHRRSTPLNRMFRAFSFVALVVALVAVAGCSKKPATPPPAAATAPAVTPPPAPAPVAQITATPNVVSAGDQVVLTWRTADATSVSIDGIGDVPTAGVRTVTPTASTSYHLVARGEGGTADATASVTVNAPPAVVVPTTKVSVEDEFKTGVQDAFFDYDTYDIRADAQAILVRDASFLVAHPDVKVLIGGYCDERGSSEYNLALGQNRADAAKNALVAAGVAPNRIRVVSYGKEKPFCSESTEECWQQNRRAGFSFER